VYWALEWLTTNLPAELGSLVPRKDQALGSTPSVGSTSVRRRTGMTHGVLPSSGIERGVSGSTGTPDHFLSP